jgi:hypothetical protein
MITHMTLYENTRRENENMQVESQSSEPSQIEKEEKVMMLYI